MSWFIFIFGLVIGSFLNVCIYRLPKEQSIIWPPSSCPYCSHRLRWYELLPVVSFLLLKGKCSECGEPISIRYPAVELFTALIALLLYLKFGLSWALISFFLLSCFLIMVAFIDAAYWKIPDMITLPGILLGIFFSFFNPGITILESLIGLLVGGGILLLIGLVYQGGMGGGDIKLMAMVGSFTGWFSALLIIFLAALLGSIYGLVMIFQGRKGRKSKVQFGVFLALATFLIIFFGEGLKDWYITLILG
ncbi:MAG: prepilin peptidase [Halanaerobium sp.]|nr:prepilin peptidase [Halanaerobium sp.]